MKPGPKRLSDEMLQKRGSPWLKQRQRRGELTNIRIPARRPSAVKTSEIVELQISKSDEKLFEKLSGKMRISTSDFILSFVPPNNLLKRLLDMRRDETQTLEAVFEYEVQK